MEWIVAPSADERLRGQLLPETQSAAHAALRQHGCVLLRGAFPVALVEAMHEEYVARYGALDARGMLEQARRPPPNPIDPRGSVSIKYSIRIALSSGA